MERLPPPLVLLAVGLVAGLSLAALAPGATLVAAPLLVAAHAFPAVRRAGQGALLGLLLGVGPARARAPPPLATALDLPAIHVLEGRVRKASPPGPDGTRAVLDLDRIGEVPASDIALRLTLEAGAGPRLRPGDRVRVPARVSRFPHPHNPGAPASRRRWLQRGVHLRGWVPSPGAVEVRERAVGLGALVATWRLDAAASFDRYLDSSDAGLARALLLGDRSTLQNADRRRFTDTGQGHLVAVSGLHVGLLIAGLLLLLRHMGLGVRPASALGLVAVLVYVPLAGAPPSAVRAGSAAVLYFAGRLISRRVTASGVLAAVATGVLVLDPNRLVDPALSLSLAAVLGILLLRPRLTDLLVPPRPVLPGLIAPPRAFLRRALALALAAWLGTFWLIAAVFGRVCPAAAPLSVLAVPLAALLVGTGFLMLLLGSVPLLGVLLQGTFAATAEILRSLLDTALALGLGAVPVAPLHAAWFALYGTTFLVAALGPERVGRFALAGLGVLIAATLVPEPFSPPAHPRVVVLDVGHGQAAVLLLPDGRAALLDAGRMGDPDVGRRVVVPALGALGVQRLALAVVSHGDQDHVGGIPDVHAQVPVSVLVVPPGFDHRVRAWLEDAGLDPRPVARDEVLLQGAWGVLRVLSPPAIARGPRSRNDRGLVVRLETTGGMRMLFPADIETLGVDDFLGVEGDPHADVLLLPHHGRPGEGRDRLFRAVRPTWWLASCGRMDPRWLPPRTLSTWGSGALIVDLTDDGATVRTPWAIRETGYDPAPTPMHLSSLPSSVLPLLAVAFALLVMAVLSSRFFGWLTGPGALGAWVLGTVCFAFYGAAGLAALFAPFLVGTLLGRLPGATSAGARTLRQVTANGLGVLLGCAIAILGAPGAGFAAVLGALATLGADTCATEIGTRWGGVPRSLLTGRTMHRGESGGVTPAGLLASVGGGALAPLAAWAFSAIDVRQLLLLALAGVAGALLDSVLGATLQYRGRDAETGAITEARRTAAGPTERHSGIAWLDNDAVNLVAGLAGALVAVALLA